MTKPQPEDSERPPVFATWTGWYVLLVSALALSIVLFTLFQRHYA
ncbi:MAG: hypothetical protein R3F17_08950 [Planctomycetota bacterium]